MFPMVAGIWPVKKLFDKLRDLMLLKFPISEGISPDSVFADRSMANIRLRNFELYV
jgi:hypothetical protein